MPTQIHPTAARLYEAAASLHSLTQPSKIAAKMHISQQTIKNWETRGVSRDGLLDAQKYLGINPDWIKSGLHPVCINATALPKNSSVNLEQKQPLGRIPIISWSRAAEWGNVVNKLVATEDEAEYTLTSAPVSPRAFALRVRDDSMVSLDGKFSFPEDAIIVVDPDREAQSKNFVIVRHADGETTFKQLIVDGRRAYLKALNPRYPITEMQHGDTICGVVIKVEMDTI